MTAADLVTELETLPPGEPFAAVVAAAESAIAAERAVAESVLFPAAIAPRSADVIATYRDLEDRFRARSFADDAAAAHQRAITSWPELAAAFRSPELLSDLYNAVAAFATPRDHRETHGAAGAREGAAAVKRYKATIARQLAHQTGELGEAARALVRCDELEARVHAKREALEAAAAAEVARVRDEQREAARAVAVASAQRLAEAQAAAISSARSNAEAQHLLRAARATAFADRLRASGLRTLRVGDSDHGAVYSTEELARTAPTLSLALLTALEHALDRAEAGR